MKKLQKEKGKWKGIFTLSKFANNEAVKNNCPFEEKVIGENILVNAGINALLTLLAGGGGQAFDNAHAYLGVGDSSTAASASQTDLVAATNKLRVAMNASYPTYGSSQQIVFQSDFTGAQANYAWNEMACFNASSAGTMLDRLVSAQGTKTAGQTWRLTLTLTLS